ncbi:hypothetical protein [Stenotrophomonas maltophilia]|uniref:hypothetical protein n=1 Tax=Stenotrophomonas maltophilia TaxID=40324 RepID=UPI0013DB4425|nr:hypothetical protein [Stenotrophomonas maltophilia]
MQIPKHIADVLGCSTVITKTDLRAYLDSLADVQLPWFLAGDEPKDALISAIFDEGSLVAKVLQQVVENPRNLYYRATDGGVYACSLISFGASESAEGSVLSSLPTTALSDLARAWPKFPMLIQSGLSADSEGAVVGEEVEARWINDVPRALRGKVLILREGGGSLSDEDHEKFHPVLTALAGLRVDSHEISAPKWTTHKVVELQVGGLVHRPEMLSGKLLQEALAESRARWRFIALYRVFESAYLLALVDSFKASFFANPKRATSQVKDALDSELNQFKEVVSVNSLQQYFEAIRDEAAKLSGNTLIKAIETEIRESGEKGPSWKVGVAIIYKLRCAIVHAGQKHVVFDRHQDGNDALVDLVPLLEDAVLALLGLRLS